MEQSLDRAIETLVELRDRLPAMLEGSPWDTVTALIPMVYWETDRDGRIRKLQGACEELLQTGAAQLLGRKIQSLWPHESDDLITWHDRTVCHSQAGQETWFRLAVAELDHGYRGLLIDCTSQQRAAQIQFWEREQLTATVREIQQQLTSLKQQNRYQEAFALAFGRELRTLMHRVLGLLSMLCQQPLARSQQDNAQAIQSCLEHLLELAQPLHESLGGGWAVEKNSASFEIRPLLAEVSGWLSAELDAKNMQLKMSVAPSIPDSLVGDAVKLRQTLLQLLDNAIKFSDGGEVVLELTGQKDVRFSVRDTGRGMSPEKLDGLFRDNLLEGDLTSVGLGLKLARYLVEQMEGKIWADSQPDVGTSIYFSLRFQEGSSPPSAAPVADQIAPLMILLAEDDAISQKVTLRSLTQFGHKVDIVSSGLDVLKALQRATYDVVLLDVEMPGLDGLETARQIHQRFTPTPYLIALTAGNSAADRRKVMLAGIHDFLAKPLRPQELADALTQAHGSR
ncbi:response regulator [bacterium]|nr:response regulator [bacterium]